MERSFTKWLYRLERSSPNSNETSHQRLSWFGTIILQLLETYWTRNIQITIHLHTQSFVISNEVFIIFLLILDLRQNVFSIGAKTPTFRRKLRGVERKRKRANPTRPLRRIQFHRTTPTSPSPSTTSSSTTLTSKRLNTPLKTRASTNGRGRSRRPWSRWFKLWTPTPATSGTKIITCFLTRYPTQSPTRSSRWTTHWWSWCKMAEQ